MPTADEIRSGARPAVTVVLATNAAGAGLVDCLASLRARAAAEGIELIVAHSRPTREIEAVAATYPDVRFVQCAPGVSIRQLRATGMRAASGDVVALIDADSKTTSDLLDIVESSMGRGSSF